jgi:intergrase/recombinase
METDRKIRKVIKSKPNSPQDTAVPDSPGHKIIFKSEEAHASIKK